jgi:hypothetical protein
MAAAKDVAAMSLDETFGWAESILLLLLLVSRKSSQIPESGGEAPEPVVNGESLKYWSVAGSPNEDEFVVAPGNESSDGVGDDEAIAWASTAIIIGHGLVQSSLTTTKIDPILLLFLLFCELQTN